MPEPAALKDQMMFIDGDGDRLHLRNFSGESAIVFTIADASGFTAQVALTRIQAERAIRFMQDKLRSGEDG